MSIPRAALLFGCISGATPVCGHAIPWEDVHFTLVSAFQSCARHLFDAGAANDVSSLLVDPRHSRYLRPIESSSMSLL